MFIISKFISDGETNFTPNKYNKLQNISAFLHKISAKVQIWDHLHSTVQLHGVELIDIEIHNS